MTARQRTGARRSRRGCATCKIRRIRCDEQFSCISPEATVSLSCINCKRTGRKCEGPSSTGFIINVYNPKSDAASRARTVVKPVSRCLSPFEEGELRTYDFFLRYAATDLTRGMDDDFWIRLLPQLCEHEESVRHAVLALSVFHEDPLQAAASPSYSSRQKRGMAWYKSSIQAAMLPPTTREEVEQIEHSMLTSMLFAIIEMQHANYINSRALLTHGLHLILRYQEKYPHGRAEAPPWIAKVLPMFGRQCLSIGIFRSELSPRYNDILNRLLSTSSPRIATLTDARNTLLATVHSTIQLGYVIASMGAAMGICDKHTLLELRHRQQQALEQLRDVEDGMRQLERVTTFTPLQQATYHTLVSLLKFSTIWIFWIFSPPQDLARQDPLIVNELLDHADAALHSYTPKPLKPGAAPVFLELGVVAPICFVFWQCRSDPVITQRASRLLRQASHLENMYVARLQADLVGRLLGIEAGLSLGSGRDTFEDEVSAWSYSWGQVASDALNGVRRTGKWTWEDDLLVSPDLSPGVKLSPESR